MVRSLPRLLFFFLIFIILIIPSIAITYYSYTQLHIQLTDQVTSQRRSLARQMALTVEARLEAISDVGMSVAGDADIVAAAEKGNWQKVVDQAEHVSSQFPYIDRIFISDLKGVTVAYYPPSPENTGKGFSFRDWYKGVSREWKPYISEVFKRAPHPQFNTVAVMSPIQDASGSPLGAIGFAVNLDSFTELTRNFAVDKSGFLYIVNHKGQIIAHPRYSPQAVIVDFSTVPSVQKLMKGQSGIEVMYNPIDKEERLAAYESIAQYNWGVVIADHITTAYSERDKVLSDVVKIDSLVIVFNSILALIIVLILHTLRSSQQQIKRENLKDEAILESIGDGIIATDEDGRILMMNSVAQRLLGLQLSQIIGKSFIEVIKMENEKGEVLSSEERPMRQALETKKKVAVTHYYVRPDSSKFPAAVTVTPIILHGKTIGTIEVFRDVTKETEVDRMKTEFLSLASHQLRTPLSAMKWFLEMLLHGDAGQLSKEQEEYVRNVDQSNERMIGLVNSLLNVSRIESGRIIVDPQPTDFGELVQGVVTEVQQKAQEKNQKLIVSIHEGLPKISVDPKLVRQVYMNLLTNAIKYTPNGGEITIFVSTKDNTVLSQISDTGYGIPEMDKDRVFRKFYRGDNITKQVTDGSGLGLYLVKAIIESSNGKIWYESVIGKGTTFWFSLPLTGMTAKKGEVTLDS